MSDRERQMSNDIVYMWNLKSGTNKPIYKTESQMWKTNLWLLKGGGINWKIGIDKH